MSLTALNRQRGPFKTKINKTETFIKEFQPSDYSKKDTVQLSAKLTSVNDILRGLNQINCELCALPDDVNLKDALEVTLELENFAEEMKGSTSKIPVSEGFEVVELLEFLNSLQDLCETWAERLKVTYSIEVEL
ncbi:hypothetical protein HNY73_016521 [Argiope bruennichi]|uniref:Uncharacterized protein n=1 Tax=Argiope bruennichi TaxID=94029 RepID=A0A8T0EIT0_ARGBR|nr:hypothetical protein HNY73_016521 [Argiope bruennichi]